MKMVAEIIRSHGESTIARDVLKCAGKINWSEIEPFDRDVLQKAGLICQEKS
jgi:hypothetical protein